MRRRWLAGPVLALIVATTAILATTDAADIPAADRRSGYAFMGHETRAMQDDDSANPGMLWVLDGEALWNRSEGSANRSCADCHGDARASMKGVAARYPALDASRGQPMRPRRGRSSRPEAKSFTGGRASSISLVRNATMTTGVNGWPAPP